MTDILDGFEFPHGFRFGTATSAYQIEGAATEGGRTPSIWDVFSHTGHTLNGDTGDVADDFYHRWEEDLKLVRDLGVNAYRFSVALPRVIPTPDGKPNAEGLDFYERIVDRLLEYGIAPIVTLYHWDLPQYLNENPRTDGWLNRDTAYRVADYAAHVARRLGDRVTQYTTLNEPWCSAHLSYGGTEQAPGLGEGPLTFPAAHHLNLAHGLMCQAVRAQAGGKPELSVTLNLQVSRGDADAVHRLDLIANRIFLDPMLRGDYPRELFAVTRGLCDWDFVRDGDLEIIHQPIDALGLNYYSTNRVAMSDRPQFPQPVEATTAPGAADIDWLPTDGPHTEMGWNIDPDALYETLIKLNDDYAGIALVVTENGMACPDRVEISDDGVKAVHDPERIAYLRAPGGRGPRARRRRGRARLLRVVAHGQLRVGLRLLEALRPDLRRLREPGAHPQGQLRLVPPVHRRARALTERFSALKTRGSNVLAGFRTLGRAFFR